MIDFVHDSHFLRLGSFLPWPLFYQPEGMAIDIIYWPIGMSDQRPSTCLDSLTSVAIIAPKSKR